MEVVVPMAPGQDFHFQSASASPYVSAPSSPKPFGNSSDYYFSASAPTSPSRAAAIYAHYFDWEDKASRPKPDGDGDDEEEEEEFDFAVGFDRHVQKEAPKTNLVAADQLFENGRIRPLEPPPHLRHLIKEGGGGKGVDLRSPQVVSDEVVKDRGRTAPSTLSATSARSRRGSRSLSPIRGDVDSHKSLTTTTTTTTTTSSSSSSSSSLIRSGGSKKWRLKDFLLFRSASEGRVIGRGSKDPVGKYTMLSSSRSLLPSLSNKRRSRGEDAKNSSSKPTDKNGSARRGSSQQAGSAHAMHYTMNRAASEEQKKKTPLPFNRHGLFGCLSFNPAIRSITRGFGSNSFSRGRS